jgi:ABC-2 type transport system permease protein
MRALLLITWNDLRQRFSQPSVLLLMFLAPLAVATIITVTFGSMADGSSPIEEIPVAIVNNDHGSLMVDFGEEFAAAFTTEGENALPAFIHGRVVEDESEAMTLIERGEVSAVVVLPEELSQRLTGGTESEPATVVVHTRPDRSISGDIITSVTRAILDQFAGAVAITQAVVTTVATAEGTRPATVLGREALRRLTSGESVLPTGGLITIDRASQPSSNGGFNLLVIFGAGQAVFFALFTANANATSVIREQHDGTLTRLLVAPAPRSVILGGKLVGTVVTVLAQLVLLFIAFTGVGSLLEGAFVPIWGTRYLSIALALIATALGTAGIGAIVAATARTAEQSGVAGSVISMIMAAIGGAFGFRVSGPVRYASVVYWGTDVFEKLAAGDGEIWLDLAVLAGFGVVSFVVALTLFTRRVAR